MTYIKPDVLATYYAATLQGDVAGFASVCTANDCTDPHNEDPAD